mgnify:CR=1 FL=1
MTPANAPAPSGSRIVLGTVVGAFLGLLVGKFALGLLAGFFVGVALSTRARKRADPAPPARSSDTSAP